MRAVMPAEDSKPATAKPERAASEQKKKKKKQSVAELQKDLRELAKPDPSVPVKPPFDLKKIALRVGLVLAVLWIVVFFLPTWSHIPKIVVAVLTLVVVGAAL